MLIYLHSPDLLRNAGASSVASHFNQVQVNVGWDTASAASMSLVDAPDAV